MAHVAGYTIANDYAIRDYLENWYRPNLRVKSRDGATALGPWLVDAADVEAPPQRALRTLVNGRQTQSGHTRDLVFDIAFLIEYLSAFMTLAPGDVILTGTPEGVVNVDVGDEVVVRDRRPRPPRQPDRRRRRVRPRRTRRRERRGNPHESRASDRRPAGRRPRATSRRSIRRRRRSSPKSRAAARPRSTRR